ncbi:Tol-Pal system protein TolB [Thermoflexales bacterium]|nr:Tol-Pal system protein TolB [Thermoflexales bacterium]
MSSLFRRPASSEPEKEEPPPIVLSRRQAGLIVVFFLINLLIMIVLAVLALSAPSVQIVEKIVPQAVSLPTRTLVPTATPLPVTPTPTPISPFGGGGALAFTLRRNGNADIYAVNAGDKQLVRLVSHPADDRGASFSPDGQEIAFASHRDGNWEIYRMEIAGGVTARLTFSSTYDGAPAWSPDGEQIVFESYRDGNLDLYTMDRDGQNVKRLTTSLAPDMNPAWSPDGQSIAFASYRDNNKDIYLLPLDSEEGEDDLANLTNTPDREEDNPAWSPNGTQLAYTSGRPGDQLIYVNTFDLKYKSLQEAEVGLFGQGSEPTWSPDGKAIVFTYHRGDSDVLIGANLGGWGVAQEAFGGREYIVHPTWSKQTIPQDAIQRSLDEAPLKAPPLYTEVVSPTGRGQPPYVFVQMENIKPSGQLLSDAVDDSFRALRARVLLETGIDYLDLVGNTWRSMNHTPREGQSRRSYHVTGRAVDINQTAFQSAGDPIVIVREDIGSVTYWRVFIKAKNQDGSMGEPLREAPWLLQTGTAEGGRLMETIPPGYYVDFTTLAKDYGWNRVRAIWRWRSYYPDVEWWHFQKTDGLPWWDAMEQVYTEEDIIKSYGPYPGYD